MFKLRYSLLFICLGKNNISNEGIKYLSEGLKSNYKLAKLDLGKSQLNIYEYLLENNNIGDEGVKYIHEALKSNQGKSALNNIVLGMYIYIYLYIYI